jgi:uncharacterized membrane protein
MQPFETVSHKNIGDVERAVSLAAGGLLVLFGLSRRSLSSAAIGLAGASLLHRGITGHCNLYSALDLSEDDIDAAPWNRAVHARFSITINRPRHEVYAFFRDFEKMPQYTEVIEDVRKLDDRRYQMVANIFGTQMDVIGEIISEHENELLAWKTTANSDLKEKGSVTLRDAPGGRGTELHFDVEYHPPAGVAGAALGKMSGEAPDQKFPKAIRKMKSILEAGEAPTIVGQSSGRSGKRPRTLSPMRMEASGVK